MPTSGCGTDIFGSASISHLAAILGVNYAVILREHLHTVTLFMIKETDKSYTSMFEQEIEFNSDTPLVSAVCVY